jgi:hypothetical protein
VIPLKEIPANYRTVFDLYYWANNTVPSANFRFTLDAYYFVSPDQKSIYELGYSVHEHGIGHLPVVGWNQEMVQAAKAIGPRKAILVGTQDFRAV